MEKYFCPNCGAVLDDQIGFDPSSGVWECSECGQVLFGDDVADTQIIFDDVVWYCDNCDAVLNQQPGFVDFLGSWVCTECGYENEINEEGIIDSPPPSTSKTLRRLERFNRFLERINEMLAQNDTSSDGHDESDNSDSDCSCSQDDSDREDEDNAETEAQQRNLAMQPPVGAIIQPSTGKQILYHIIRKKIETKLSSAELIGKNIRDVYTEIVTWGFYNIETIAEEDLEIDNINQEGIVDGLTINGYPTFEANSLFPFNAEVIIRYHTLKTVQPPFASKRAKGKHYQKVIASFIEAGFFNVETRPIHDLTFGWIIKDGAVEDIQIAGKCDFSTKENYRLDESIVISYHTFKQRSK